MVIVAWNHWIVHIRDFNQKVKLNHFGQQAASDESTEHPVWWRLKFLFLKYLNNSYICFIFFTNILF